MIFTSLFLTSAVLGAASKSYCPQKDQFCVVATSASCYTAHSSSPGWAAFGVGSGMKGADIYIAWKNSKGGLTFANTLGGDHAQPVVNAKQNGNLVPLTEPAPSWAKLSFSFCRASPDTPVPITPKSTFIWAFSSTAPTGDIDSTSASYTQHDAMGMMDPSQFSPFAAGGAAPASSTAVTITSTTNTASLATSAPMPAEGSTGVDSKGAYVIKYVPCEDQSPSSPGYRANPTTGSTGSSPSTPPATGAPAPSTPDTSSPAPSTDSTTAPAVDQSGALSNPSGSTDPSHAPVVPGSSSAVASSWV